MSYRVGAISTSPAKGDDKISTLNQHLSALVGCLGAFALGVSLGWCSSVMEDMRLRFTANLLDIALVSYALGIGACLGAIIAPFLVKFHRCVAALRAIVPLNLLAWFTVAFAQDNISLLIGGRSLCGICGGICCVLLPIYVAEIADKERRNRVSMIFQLLLSCGVAYSYLLAYLLERNYSVWCYSLICGSTCCLLLSTRFLKESPLCYLLLRDEKGARESLRRYRGDKYEIEHEIEELSSLTTLLRPTSTVALLKNGRVLRSIFACICVNTVHQFSGFNIFLLHALTFFQTHSSGNFSGSELTLLIALLLVTSSVAAYLLANLLSRRTMLFLSTVLMANSLSVLGWFFEKRQENPEYDDWCWWIPPTCFTAFVGGVNVGVGPLSWALLGDSFPQEMKIRCASCVASLSWFLSLIAALAFERFHVRDRLGNAFYFFSAFCWLGAIVCAATVKDNGGKSLADIQREFRANV